MKKRLHVPHPGHFDRQKELISEAGKDIYSIFMAGSPDYVSTGRSDLSSPHILLNSLCLGEAVQKYCQWWGTAGFGIVCEGGANQKWRT